MGFVRTDGSCQAIVDGKSVPPNQPPGGSLEASGDPQGSPRRLLEAPEGLKGVPEPSEKLLSSFFTLSPQRGGDARQAGRRTGVREGRRREEGRPEVRAARTKAQREAFDSFQYQGPSTVPRSIKQRQAGPGGPWGRVAVAASR